MTGELRILPATPSFDEGVAHVRVECVGPADAPAHELASVTITGVAHRAGEASSVPFALDAPGPLVRGRHAVRAWLDRDGRGPAVAGDLFSTEREEAVPGSPLIVLLKDPTTS